MTVANPKYRDLRFNADDNRWEAAKRIIGDRRVTLGPSASQQWLDAPEHLAMVLARYRAAAALIGDARTVLEIGAGEGVGSRILAKGREWYRGIDTDADAIAVAIEHHTHIRRAFEIKDAHTLDGREQWYDAVVSLDVIEHIPEAQEAGFMDRVKDVLIGPHSVCVIGTPNAAFEHLASPQSRAGHVNLYTHARLYALMREHFQVVQSFGMNDVALHMGHVEARHYLLMCGIGPKRD